MSSIAVQELIDNPPHRTTADARFTNRDWRTIRVGELTSPEDLKFIDIDASVEEAINLLISSGVPVLLLTDPKSPAPVVGTLDYNVLNAYLLTAVGIAQPGDDHVERFAKLAQKAGKGEPIPLRDIRDIGRKDPVMFLPESANLTKAIETFGKGVHRVLVAREGQDGKIEVTGLLSQTRLMRFLWENGRNFPAIEQLYSQYLRDLKIGSNNPISINGDRPLAEALALLLDEGVSSLAVLDNANNVVGNISTTDTKLLTKSSSLPLLRNTCIHFISVILSTRGMFEGQDSFPVFYVTPMNTLAHTVAKLVATKSHRMWVTEPVSPLSSGPSTPALHTTTMVPLSSHNSSISAGSGQHHLQPPPPTSSDPLLVADASPKTPMIAPSGPTISASSLPGARISGRLVGVVSLTDVLILMAKAGGLETADPNEIRLRRRRSSSSSVRRSIDLGTRPLRPSGDLSRRTSDKG